MGIDFSAQIFHNNNSPAVQASFEKLLFSTSSITLGKRSPCSVTVRGSLPTWFIRKKCSKQIFTAGLLYIHELTRIIANYHELLKEEADKNFDIICVNPLARQINCKVVKVLYRAESAKIKALHSNYYWMISSSSTMSPPEDWPPPLEAGTEVG